MPAFRAQAESDWSATLEPLHLPTISTNVSNGGHQIACSVTGSAEDVTLPRLQVTEPSIDPQGHNVRCDPIPAQQSTGAPSRNVAHGIDHTESEEDAFDVIKYLRGAVNTV